MDKSPDAFRTISEVGEDLDIPQHVLRFWETRFTQIKPLKRGGGRRYYRPDDVDLLKGIRRLLYGEGYTIKGVQRILKEQGARHVVAIGRGAALPEAAASAPDADHAPAPVAAPAVAVSLRMPEHGPEGDIHLAPTRRDAVADLPHPSPARAATTGKISPKGLNRLKAALFELGEARQRLNELAPRESLD